MTDPSSDLSKLTGRTSSAPGAPHRRAAWLLPIGILAGFALLFLLLFRDRLVPAREVRVSTAIAIEEKLPVSTATAAPSGKLLFQASGWIEPDPLPLKATALVDGVVDQVHVLEGQAVKKGDLLATLIDADAKLELASAKSDLEMTKAEFDAHCTNAQITLQKLDAEKAGLVSDQANADEAADRLRRLEQAATSAVELERVNARFDSSRRQADLLARKAKIEELGHELTRISYEAASLLAKVETAKSTLGKAELALSRTRISSPINGRVLRLMAAPGQKKMLLMDEDDSSTIAVLYDPAHLQVRVDVPLADAAGLGAGQKAKVRCNLLPDRVFEGEVTRITGEADLLRNTLQAKVRILAPDDRLRPEMLCRVEFLETAPASAAATPAGDSMGLAVYVPQAAVKENAVWVCDPESNRVTRREVIPSPSGRDHFQRIDQGLRPGEWVVLDAADLRENQRVSPKMEGGL
jgi:HlyD family secretion protein